jgi:hypothetical protein
MHELRVKLGILLPCFPVGLKSRFILLCFLLKSAKSEPCPRLKSLIIVFCDYIPAFYRGPELIFRLSLTV